MIMDGIQVDGTSNVIDLENPAAENLTDMAKHILESFPIVTPSYCVPFVLSGECDFGWAAIPCTKSIIDSFKAIGKKYFGKGATCIPLPISFGNVETMH